MLIFGCTAFVKLLEQFSASWLMPEEVWMVEIELFHDLWFPKALFHPKFLSGEESLSITRSSLQPTRPRLQNRMRPFTHLNSAFDSIYFKRPGPERRLKHSRNSFT